MIKKIYFSVMFVIVSVFCFSSAVFAVTCDESSGYKYDDSVNLCLPQDTKLPEASLKDIIINVMEWLLQIFGALAIISFAISGVQYFSAAGDEKAAETAKNHMKWSIIGVIVGLSGYIILQAVDIMLGGLSTDF